MAGWSSASAPARLDGRWEVADTAAVRARVRAHRTSDRPFDVAVPGESDPAAESRHALFAAHEAAGATWWVEAVHPWRYGWTDGAPWPLAALHERILAGP